MKSHLAVIFILISITLKAQNLTEVFVPGVGGTLFDGSLVKAWDANSNEFYGERFTNQSLALFDNITSVENESPVTYSNAGILRDKLVFGNDKQGSIDVYVIDILGRGGKMDYDARHAGNHEIRLSELIPSSWANAVYPVKIVTPTHVFDMAIGKVDGMYTATKVASFLRSGVLRKGTLDDQVRFVVSGDGHYTRTFVADKDPRIEDYVVEYVDQMKTDGTPVTPEEFKQYCADFNMNSGAGGMGWGLKSFFPNEDKQIWIASKGPPGGEQYTFNQEQMESIRDLVVQEIYPYIEPQNQPSFYLDDPSNPEPIPLQATGKIVIFPKSAGYSFGTGGDPQTNVIKYGTVAAYHDLDLGDITQPPANDLERNSRMGVLEEVASCFMGPRGNQGGLYTIMYTIMNGGAKMHPIDIKLMEMTQKYQPMTHIDDILGLTQ